MVHRLKFIVMSVALACAFQLGGPAAFSDTYIIQTSDSHSAFDRMALFIKAVSALRVEIMSRDPDAQIILKFNGDFGGASEFTTLDKGDAGYDAVAALSADYGIVVVMGNHEGFDEKGAAGNELFLRQNKSLVDRISRVQGKPFRVLAANVVPQSLGKDLFAPYADFKTKEGVPFRVVGMVLEPFFTASTYDRFSYPQLIKSISPVHETLYQQMEQARRDGVHTVIPMIHDGVGVPARLLENLSPEWLAQNQLNIPLMFAGHDHRVVREKIRNTWLVDSGSGFSFTLTVLDKSLKVVGEPKYFGERAQRDLAVRPSHFTLGEARALVAIEESMRDVDQINGVVIGHSRGFRSTKHQLKKGRDPLGDSVSNSLADWARVTFGQKSDDLLADHGLKRSDILGFFGFYNSSSYRREKPIPEGPLTRYVPISIYPMPGTGDMLIVTGAQVEALYKAFRTHLHNMEKYSPQISSNLKADEDFSLQTVSENGEWLPLKKDGRYVLAMDHWMATNGYDVPGWRDIINTPDTVRIPTQTDIRDVLLQFLPSHLGPEECTDEMDNLELVSYS